MTSRLGFVGLGSMGEAMATNLLRSGRQLVVWNRTDAKSELLAREGAEVARDVRELFEQCDIVFVMLANAGATDEVLGRGHADFTSLVRDHVLVMTGTLSPSYARNLEREVRAAGGRYVEAPVSGSRKPAEDGQLVAMMAGDRSPVDAVRAHFDPLCGQIIYCGEVPSGLIMKLAVNVFLIGQVTALAECVHFSERHGVDKEQLLNVLNSGQMASDISRVKLPKLLERDFAVQARISDVLQNSRLIVDAATDAGIVAPILELCHELFSETMASGLGDSDMVAVLRAIEERTSQR